MKRFVFLMVTLRDQQKSNRFIFKLLKNPRDFWVQEEENVPLHLSP